ncbi:uncharacterized protein LOC116347695 [Contarinia nasturtii]|uniref:uncharacterized protein LOC116347695 n=1 Tax=Contarinia nasturtii TaxID=265458 RepID=UPI0012D3AD2C|nr:uncharacterized protein LOC116347695 [Contarinia nasturtii]
MSIFKLTLMTLLSFGYFKQRTSAVISSSDIHCAVLDSMYINEDFEGEISSALERTTNLAGNPLIDFSVKLPSAIISCAADYEAFSGAIIPVFFDTLKEEFENKESLGKIIDTFERRNEVHNGIVEKGITISKVLFSLKKVSEYPATICSVLKYAHNDLHTIVLHFASRNLPYRNFPSATAQLMLAIAPMATMIARTLPYLEWGTEMNCRLRDLFDDYYQLSLLHRFRRIEVTSRWKLQGELIFNIVASSALRNKLNRNVSGSYDSNIKCRRSSDDDIFTIRDNLEYVKGNKITAYTGDASCVYDYFSLVKYRMESVFGKSFKMLDKTCSNSRGFPTGYGWLIIEVQAAYITVDNVHVRFFIDSQGKNAVYTSQVLTSQEQWIEINDVYRSSRLNKNASITIDMKDVEGVIRYVYPKKKIDDFLIHSNFIETTGTDNLLFYPIWIDEYSNDNYFKTLTSGGVKKPSTK